MTPHFAFGQQKILVSKANNEIVNPNSAMSRDSLLMNCQCERSTIPFKDYDGKTYYVYVDNSDRMFVIRKRENRWHKDYLKKLGE